MFLVEAFKYDISLTCLAAWVGLRICVCRFVGICYHVLITQTVAPGSLGGRQPSAPRLVSGSVFWGPTCCWLPSLDARLPRFPTGDGRANTHNTTTGHDPPSVTGRAQTHPNTFLFNILHVLKNCSSLWRKYPLNIAFFCAKSVNV